MLMKDKSSNIQKIEKHDGKNALEMNYDSI